MHEVRVAVNAPDPLIRAGLVKLLRSRPGFALLDEADRAQAQVLLAVCERLSVEVITMLRLFAADVRAPVILVPDQIAEDDLPAAVDCRVVDVLPQAAVTPDRLLRSVARAAIEDIPAGASLLADLTEHLSYLHETVIAPDVSGEPRFSPRELEVLRLLADGLDTNEIAGRLAYSERTVKNVIHGVTTRLQLRNRSHAVAYALRSGSI